MFDIGAYFDETLKLRFQHIGSYQILESDDIDRHMMNEIHRQSKILPEIIQTSEEKIIVHQNPDEEKKCNKGLNVLGVCDTLENILNEEAGIQPNMFNLFGLLAAKANDPRAYPCTSNKLLAINLIISFFRILMFLNTVYHIMFVVIFNLFNYSSCVQQVISFDASFNSSNCDVEDMSGYNLAFRIIKSLIELIVSLIIIYDCTSAPYTTYSRRAKMYKIAKHLGLEGDYSVFIARYLLWVLLIISTSDKLDKDNDPDFDLVKFFKLPHDVINGEASVSELYDYIFSKEIILFLLIFLLILTIVVNKLKYKMQLNHPFLETYTNKHNKNAEIIPKNINWTKIGVFVLTSNIILACTMIAGNMKELLDLIRLDEPYDWAYAQIHIIIMISLFLCTTIIAMTSMEHLDSHDTPQRLLWTGWFIIHCSCSIGLDYSEFPKIQLGIIIFVSIVIFMNLLYLWIRWPLDSFSTLMRYVSWELTTTNGLAIIIHFLSSCFTLGSVFFAYKSLIGEFMVVNPSWNKKISDENKSRIPFFRNFRDLNAMNDITYMIQYSFIFVLLLSGIFIIYLFIFDRMEKIRKNNLFWGYFLILLLNTWGLIYTHFVSKNFEIIDLYSLTIDGYSSGLDNAKIGYSFMMVGTFFQLLYLLIAPTCVNKFFDELRNPSFINPQEDKVPISHEANEIQSEYDSTINTIKKIKKRSFTNTIPFIIIIPLVVLSIVMSIISIGLPWITVQNKVNNVIPTNDNSVSSICNGADLINALNDFITNMNGVNKYIYISTDILRYFDLPIILNLGIFFNGLVLIVVTIFEYFDNNNTLKVICAFFTFFMIIPEMGIIILLPIIVEGVISKIPFTYVIFEIGSGYMLALISHLLALAYPFILLTGSFFPIYYPSSFTSNKEKTKLN